jgi:hypothetical protein
MQFLISVKDPKRAVALCACSALDVDKDGFIGRHDLLHWYRLAVARHDVTGDGVPPFEFEYLRQQLHDMLMTGRGADCATADRGISISQLRTCGMAPGVIAVLLNFRNMMVERQAEEWGGRRSIYLH